MSNVNPDNLNLLNNIFVELDKQRRSKLLFSAYKLSVEQTVEKELKDKNKRMPYAKELEEAVTERMADLSDFLKLLFELDETGLAVIAMMMEKLRPGSMTTERDTVVTTTHTRTPLGRMLKESLPDADFAAARKTVSKFLSMEEQS